jgi:hypothetical protein
MRPASDAGLPLASGEGEVSRALLEVHAIATNATTNVIVNGAGPVRRRAIR